MKRISSTELARNLRQILDNVAYRGEEVVIIRNKQLIARIVPGVQTMSALEAMADLYQTLPLDAGKDWVKDSKRNTSLSNKIVNPWDI